MIRNAVDTLVELTHNLGLATIGNQLYMSGLSNLFGQPEFMVGGQAQQVARLLDNLEPWLREAAPNEPLSVYIGAENPIGRSAGVTLIISRFRSPFSDRSYIGTLGPTRQSYREVMQLVSRAGQELEEVLYA
jgi:heat-inducible transcriptional repressor